VGEIEQDSHELEFLEVIEIVGVQPKEAGWREGGRGGGEEGRVRS